jgi:hypothetical protein
VPGHHPTIILAFHLVRFTGLDGQPIDIYPEQVVSTRPIRDLDHFDPKIKCIIHTTDGKFISVVEDCNLVRQKLEQESNEP